MAWTTVDSDYVNTHHITEAIRYDLLEFRSEESIQAQLDKIRPLLERLPRNEADLIELTFFRGKHQNDLAAIWGCTQAAVCYRIRRGIKRLRFLLALPVLEEIEMRKDLIKFFDDVRPHVRYRNKPYSNKMIVDVCVAMYQTTCQTFAGELLHSTQCSVRHGFKLAIKLLTIHGHQEHLKPYLKAFIMVMENLNILHNVAHPQYENQMKNNRDRINVL